VNEIYKKYYLPYKKEKETKKELIQRIDRKIIEDRFNHICNRDILIFEEKDGFSNMD